MLNKKIINTVTRNFNNYLYKNKKFDIKNYILIVGSPRSGTTWLLDILIKLPGYTSIFEPLNPIWFPESFEVGFRSRTYLKSDSLWAEGKNYLTKIFTGQIANLPIKDTPLDLFKEFSINNFFAHLLGSKLIIKSVNMNRMLPWITKNFQLNKKETFSVENKVLACNNLEGDQRSTNNQGLQPKVFVISKSVTFLRFPPFNKLEGEEKK